MTDDAENKKRRSFTSEKLDWISALGGDPRINPRAFKIGVFIAQHVSMKTGVAILSDEVLTDKTNIPRSWVIRARKLLRETRWIDWKRTKTANIYWTSGENINRVLDLLAVRKDDRESARAERRSRRSAVPRVKHLNGQDVPGVKQQDVPPVELRDVPPVGHIHLSTYTLEVTPEERGLGGKEEEEEEERAL